VSPAGDAAVTGTPISSVAYNGQNSDIAAELTNSVDRLGRGGMLANLPMGSNRITGLGNPVGAQDAVTLATLESYAASPGQMAPQPNNTVLANISGGASAPAAVTLAALAAAAAPTFASLPGAIGLTVSNQTVASPSSQVSIAALSAVVVNAAGLGVQLTFVLETASLSVSGLGGLDVGAVAANTWYNVYLIYNPTGGTAGALLSLSEWSPTLPSGFTFFARLGSCRTDGSNNLYRFVQRGNRFQWALTAGTNTTSMMLLSGTTGSVTTPTWTQIALYFVGPTATAVDCVMVNSGTTNFIGIAAPNANYGAADSASNPPPMQTNSTYYTVVSKIIVLETFNLYAALQSNVVLYVAGFVDSVNAC